MDPRKERVERLTRDIMELLHAPAAEPAAYLECPNCAHRIALILAEAQAAPGPRGRRGRPAATRAPRAAALASPVKQRKPPTIGPVLKLVRKLASDQRVVTGKIFKAMNASIGDVSGLSKPEKQKRQLAWLKAQFKPSRRRARRKQGKKAA